MRSSVNKRRSPPSEEEEDSPKRVRQEVPEEEESLDEDELSSPEEEESASKRLRLEVPEEEELSSPEEEESAPKRVRLEAEAKLPIAESAPAPAPVPPTPEPRLMVGFDPGKTALGMGIYDPKTNKARLIIEDVNKIRGKKYKVERRHLSFVINRFVRVEWRPILMVTKCVFLEDQIVPCGSREVLEIMVLIEQSIRLTYAHIQVYRVNPRTLRSFFGTSGGEYDERKRKSRMLFRELCVTSHMDFERIFIKRTAFKVDAIEACLFAIYGYLHLDEFIEEGNQLIQQANVQSRQRTVERLMDCRVQLDLSRFLLDA